MKRMSPKRWYRGYKKAIRSIRDIQGDDFIANVRARVSRCAEVIHNKWESLPDKDNMDMLTMVHPLVWTCLVDISDDLINAKYAPSNGLQLHGVCIIPEFGMPMNGMGMVIHRRTPDVQTPSLEAYINELTQLIRDTLDQYNAT